jgi:hypothetical protein
MCRCVTFGLGLSIVSASVEAGAPNVKKLGAECQQGKAKACAEITQLARTHTSLYVREEAAAYVTDPAALAEIARQDTWYGVRKVAVNRITDPAVLAGIVKGDAHAGVRKAALDRLNDDDALVDIARTHADLDLRVTAVGRVSGQALLIELVLNKDTPEPVRKAALEKVTDPEGLARIGRGLEESYGFAYNAAKTIARRLTEQKLLAGLATGATSRFMREAARGSLTDATALGEIAKADTEGASEEILKIEDAAVLADVASNARSAKVRLLALQKVGDRALLAKLGKSDPDPTVRTLAVQRLAALKADVQVTGTVVEASLGQPAAQFKISLVDRRSPIPKAEAVTDAEGRFSFRGVDPGNWSVYHDRVPLHGREGYYPDVKVPATGRLDLGTIEIRHDELVAVALASVCDGQAAPRLPAGDAFFFKRKDGITSGEPSSRWAHSYASAKSVSPSSPWKLALCVVERSSKVGDYTDKTGRTVGSAYSTTWDVRVVRLDSGQTWQRSFYAAPPRETTSYGGSAYGSGNPASQVADWLKTLP